MASKLSISLLLVFSSCGVFCQPPIGKYLQGASAWCHSFWGWDYVQRAGQKASHSLWSEFFLVSQDAGSQVGDNHIHLSIPVNLGNRSGNINPVEFPFEWSWMLWVLYTVSEDLIQNLWRPSSNAHGWIEISWQWKYGTNILSLDYGLHSLLIFNWNIVGPQ